MPLSRACPLIPSSSIDSQVAFYRDTLGFAVGYQDETYAYLERDGVAIRLVQVEPGTDLTDTRRQHSFYIDVVDVDGLYETLGAGLARLPPGRVRAVFDQPYGQREFHVIDEDCTLIFFGEAIR